MKQFKNILVVAGGDAAQTRRLLTPAIELAAPASGIVTLLSLRTRAARGKAIQRRNSATPSTAALHRLYDPGPELRKLGVPVHHETANGVPHLEILERIAVYGHDLVIMLDEPEPVRSRISGRSTVARVLRSSPIPVWIHPENGWSSGPIAVAIGPRTEEDPDNHLSRKLVAVGASLARSNRRDLHLIHAWRLDGETLMSSRRLSYEMADIERMGREAQVEARMHVEDLLADNDAMDVSARVHIEKGHAGDVVAALSDRLEPAVLVMGTIARQGIQGFVVGNTVERVARRTQSPILAVKPDGFLSGRLTVEDWSPQALPY